MDDDHPAASPPPGPGVDARGVPVIDPTKNVLDLVRAETKRQDDLREMSSAHLTEIANLRAEYDEKLRRAESARLDAIRSVSDANVQRAAEVAAEAVQTLATQVPITAEAVRTTLAQTVAPIQTDIQALRQAQYEQQGQKAAQVETKADTTSTSMLRVAIIGMSITVAAFFLSLAIGIAGFLIAKQ